MNSIKKKAESQIEADVRKLVDDKYDGGHIAIPHPAMVMAVQDLHKPVSADPVIAAMVSVGIQKVVVRLLNNLDLGTKVQVKDESGQLVLVPLREHFTLCTDTVSIKRDGIQQSVAVEQVTPDEWVVRIASQQAAADTAQDRVNQEKDLMETLTGVSFNDARKAMKKRPQPEARA